MSFQPNGFQPDGFQRGPLEPRPGFQPGAFQQDAFQMGTPVATGPQAPVFTDQPDNVTITLGSPTTLTVAASGSPSPTFQWYSGVSGDTSTPLVGETSVNLTVTPGAVGTYDYWCRATNTEGTADSNTATVTVQDVSSTVSSGGGGGWRYFSDLETEEVRKLRREVQKKAEKELKKVLKPKRAKELSKQIELPIGTLDLEAVQAFTEAEIKRLILDQLILDDEEAIALILQMVIH